MLGINGQCIKEKDLGGLPFGLRYGDTIKNNNYETLYYAGNNHFYLITSNPLVYLSNPKGPWFIYLNATFIDNRPPMQKIKEWLYSSF
jgi:hypothetical protein